jgi:hypothetical protein
MTSSPVLLFVFAWACLGVCVVIVGYAWVTRHSDDPLTDTDRACSQVDEELDRIAGVA